MHKFLRAVGFLDITKKELADLIREITAHPTTEKITRDSEGNEFSEITREFGDHFGIALRGVYGQDDKFEMEYYYPFFFGKNISTMERADVEKHAEKESYAGVCDEVRLGVTLIFYLQNVVEYLTLKNYKAYRNQEQGIILAALSTEGKILFPVNKKERQLKNEEKNSTDRNYLIAAAREGDEDAIENLTLEDIDTYSLLSRRITHEDILSIVESYFMPYGIESDQYSVMGEIMDYRKCQNELTGQNVYVLDILCNDMNFAVCINEKDLLGVPEVGRRFKGNIWMQGSINYKD